ncbi:MAG: hypothetical protein ACTS46_00605 [Candidatus Hodgkinia cicadicola]
MGNNADRSMKLTFALLTLTSLISAERCAQLPFVWLVVLYSTQLKANFVRTWSPFKRPLHLLHYGRTETAS